jgi:hypothetical protein
MLKTTIDQPGQPNKALMVLGILQGYLRNPLWFLLGTLFTLPKFKKSLPKELEKDFVDVTALQTWMYLRLKERIGQEKAYEVIRAVVIPAGLAVQQGTMRTVEAPRTFENFIVFHEQMSYEGLTRWSKKEVLEQSENRYEWQILNCGFYEFFSRIGVPELTKLMCEVDNAVYNTYLPDELTFHRNGVGNRIADGAKTCHFILKRHKTTDQGKLS